MASFSNTIAAFQREYENDMTQILKSIVLESLSRIIERTPVDTGRLRGNWQVAVGSAPDTELTITDKTGSATMQKARGIISDINLDTRIILVNNLPYARVVEEGLYPGVGPATSATNGGIFSTLATEGMLEITVAEMDDIINQAIREVS